MSRGGVLLRPWMLGFRCDFGLPGLQEPEETERLMELILTETFRADSDLPGVEKVAVTIPDSSWLEKAYTPLPPLPGYGGLVHNRLSIDPAFYMWPASNGGGGGHRKLMQITERNSMCFAFPVSRRSFPHTTEVGGILVESDTGVYFAESKLGCSCSMF